MEHIDLLIVGAGWHGLIMAKTYLEAHSHRRSPVTRPDDRGASPEQREQREQRKQQQQPSILLLDAGQTIGGTWDAARLYPGLKTNNALSTYELSDFPLVPEKYGILGTGGHIPGHVVHQYLSDVAEHFGITPLIRFSTRVDTAVLRDDATWLVSYSSSSTTDTSSLGNFPQQRDHGQLIAVKMAVATGLTSEPHIPSFVGRNVFKGAVYHAKELRSRTIDLASARNVVVIGGNKSAWDACYLYAASTSNEQQQQVVVHMVIRPSGGGPSWVWRPSKKIMGFNFSISRMSATRLLSWFDPSPLGRSHGLPRRFLRRTWPGRLLSSLFWAVLDRLVLHASGYRDRDPSVRMLRPWNSTYWMGSSLSIHNYETEWFDLVRSGRVVVHHAEIASLGERVAHLTDGDDVEADTIVCCTGWKNESTVKFGPPAIVPELGLPGSPGLASGEEAGSEEGDDDRLVASKAREQVLRQCPELLFKKPLLHHHHHARQSSVAPAANQRGDREPCSSSMSSPSSAATLRGRFHLYHFMIPPSERMVKLRNLAFIGMHQSVHTTMIAQAQALWATAFFAGRVPGLSAKKDEELQYETCCESEYQRLRRPKEGAGAGGQYLDLVFDTLPYVDCLLEDVGVRTQRKSTWWREVFEPYTLSDYRGIVQE